MKIKTNYHREEYNMLRNDGDVIKCNLKDKNAIK